MPINFAKIKKSTLAWLSVLLFNVTASQVTAVQQWVTPKLIHHPRIAAFAASMFGLVLLFHNPQVQLFLKKLPFGQPTVPVAPGAALDDVVVTEHPDFTGDVSHIQIPSDLNRK